MKKRKSTQPKVELPLAFGDKVQYSQKAFAGNIPPYYVSGYGNRYGTVIGIEWDWQRRIGLIKVQWVGLSLPAVYHPSFIERAK